MTASLFFSIGVLDTQFKQRPLIDL